MRLLQGYGLLPRNCGDTMRRFEQVISNPRYDITQLHRPVKLKLRRLFGNMVSSFDHWAYISRQTNGDFLCHWAGEVAIFLQVNMEREVRRMEPGSSNGIKPKGKRKCRQSVNAGRKAWFCSLSLFYLQDGFSVPPNQDLFSSGSC